MSEDEAILPISIKEKDRETVRRKCKSRVQPLGETEVDLMAVGLGCHSGLQPLGTFGEFVRQLAKKQKQI